MGCSHGRMTADNATEESAPTIGPPEIFIGIVGPLGSPTDQLQRFLESELQQCGYKPLSIRFSDELAKLIPHISSFADERAKQLIHAGNKVCLVVEDSNAVARLGIQRLIAMRADNIAEKRAWILRSLKRPEEVALLRNVYGSTFYVLAVNTSYETRIRHFATAVRLTRPTLREEEAEALAIQMIEQDECETAAGGTQYGQNVRETFPRADVIVPGDRMDALEVATRRFVKLLFGEIRVPTPDEHAMYLADGSAALSSSPGRTVGACLATEDGEVIAVGSNEVPKAGGGQYGDADPYGRDKDLDADYSTLSLRYLTATTLRALEDEDWLHVSDEEIDQRASEMYDLLKTKEAPLMDIIEYMRAVHAEAAAILDAARRGIPTRGSRLFTTTYPCHLCAKEIVAAGIKDVVYIENYPKSRAQSMYGEEIGAILRRDGISHRVPFVPFEGVAPRAYRRLFLAERPRRKSQQGKMLSFVPDKPRGASDLIASAQSRQTLEIGIIKPVSGINTLLNLPEGENDDGKKSAARESGQPGK